MDNKKQRKTDRRTTYTINTVKDAMLELLEKEPFDKITVASLCRQAEITRTTFYLHFSDITAVLDELLKDALQVAENSSIQDKDNILPIYAKEKNIEKIKENDILLPVCQRIANSPKYRVLFLDETLSNYTLKKMYQFEKDKIMPTLIESHKLSKDEAEIVFRFMLYGSFAVNKELNWEKNDKWYLFQKTLINFVQGGLHNLRL